MDENFKAITEYFKDIVSAFPHEIAAIYHEEKISYKEFDELSDIISYTLIDRGIKKGDVIGIMMNQSIEMLAGIFGVLKAGAAFMPIDAEFPADRIKYMCTNSKTSIILRDGNINRNDLDLSCTQIFINDIVSSFDKSIFNKNYLPIKLCGNDLAYVIYTSGSTGVPKGVMIEHSAVINLNIGMKEIVDFHVGMKILGNTRYVFDVFIVESLIALANGLNVVLIDWSEQRNPKKIIKIMKKHQIDIVQMTPSAITFYNIYDNDLKIFNNVKYILVAGEAFRLSLLELLKKYTNARIFNLYGPTEGTVYATYSELTEKADVDIGKPLKNISAYIFEEGNACQGIPRQITEIGIPGELYIGGACLARGYLYNEKLTRESFVKNPLNNEEIIYKTGDIVKWLPEGDLYFVGRKDDQVKIRGFRIELSEIEKSVLESELVFQAVIIAVDNEDLDKYLCLFYKLKTGVAKTDIINYLKKKLPDYMIPSTYIEIESMPMNDSNKIDKKELLNYLREER